MNNHVYLKSMLKKAMGEESADLFAVNAGLDPFVLYDLADGRREPDQETLLKIAGHAKNGVTYQKLREAVRADEEAVVDDAEQDAHYLEYTREEDLEKYFRKISHDFYEAAMDTSLWFLNQMMEELRDQDIWVKEKYRWMYRVGCTGDEQIVGKRVYRNVKFSLPDGNLMYTVTGTASWLPEDGEKIDDCRFQMKNFEKEHRVKTMQERYHELRPDLKDTCEEEEMYSSGGSGRIRLLCG